MAYTPSLSEINQFLGPDINPTINSIDTSKFADMVVQQSKERMARNERDAITLKNNLAEAYKSLDPSKLDGVLEDDRQMLISRAGDILSLLGSEPHALSNPNSPAFAKIQEKLNGWYTDAATSKLRKVTVEAAEKMMQGNDDFNTERNKNNLKIFRANFNAPPDQVVPIPRMTSAVPYFDIYNKETEKQYANVVDNGDGTIDEIKGVDHVNYEDKIQEAFYGKKYYDGRTLGEAYTEDIYNNDEFLKSNFPEPIDAWRYQAEVFKNPDRITEKKRELIQNIPYLQSKSRIAIAEDNNNSLNIRREENNRSANDRFEKRLDHRLKMDEKAADANKEKRDKLFESQLKTIDETTDWDDSKKLKMKELLFEHVYNNKPMPLDEETDAVNNGVTPFYLPYTKATSPTGSKSKKRTVTVNGITFDVE
jgi:hypothetical protein